jgi:hypothetical protein
MFLLDLLGAGLTLVTLAFLLLGGYLAALRLLGPRAARDPLALAIASLLAATAEAVGIALVLGGLGGGLGLLRLELALAVQAVLVLALARGFKRSPPAGGLAGPALAVARRAWEVVGEHPAASILALHAGGSELLRGLLRPPLSWDSLSYHLLLTGTWLREGNLAPVFGPIPVNYYGYAPANGSLWFWWWMAPSHSELYVNLAALPHWLLLGLATGGLARALGARRHWPLASFLVLLLPTVVRFLTTQYVDVFLASLLVSAAFFALRWLRQPSWSAAVLVGAGLGVGLGAKVLGIAYTLALAGAVVLLARWTRQDARRRTAQVAAAALIAFSLGSFFYLRNVALGADPLALQCEQTASGGMASPPTIPRATSVVGLWRVMLGEGQLLDAFLGVTRPQFLELGVGPQAFVLLLAIFALPFAVGRERRREGLFVAGVAWALLAFWLMVPFSAHHHVFANIRYIIPAFGFGFAGAVAMAERRGVGGAWIRGIALAFLAQDLLQLHAEMPRGVRVAVGVLDLLAVALALSPGLRAGAVRRRRAVAAATAALALAAAPFLARFRVEDRQRAFAEEFTAHRTSARIFAPGWGWLDRHGGSGDVAVVTSPNNYFVYPAMGLHLERRALYVNVNEEDHPRAMDYPRCQPRAEPSREAWVENLAEREVRWVYLGRYPEFPFSLEKKWMDSLPHLFQLRFSDPTNLVYEFLPAR